MPSVYEVLPVYELRSVAGLAEVVLYDMGVGLDMVDSEILLSYLECGPPVFCLERSGMEDVCSECGSRKRGFGRK